MTDAEQATHLEQELNKLIKRFRSEYHISYAATIGVLHIKAHQLAREAVDIIEDNEEDETNE